MEDRIAIIGIIVEDSSKYNEIQDILHDYGKYILGRMGIPHVDGKNIISLVVKAPQSVISALSGKVGNIESVTSKAIYSKS